MHQLRFSLEPFRPTIGDRATEAVPLECRQAFPAIEDYAIIGDCRAAVLVSRHGSIDWVCWPRFDSPSIFSPSIFAALLDRERGGYWKLAPIDAYSVERHYVPESNVLETRFKTGSGSAVLTDLMPVRDSAHSFMVPDHEIVRQLTCTSGEVQIQTAFVPRANYGEKVSRIRELGKLGPRVDCGRGVYWLRSSIPLRVEDSLAFAQATLRAGQALLFSFSYSEHPPAVLPPLEQVSRRIEICVEWWRQWTAQAQYDGDFRDEVIRSALTLKLLSFTPSRAIIAAPTTSLREHIGGSLNWDYRYCWLRDASLTVRALLELGY